MVTVAMTTAPVSRAISAEIGVAPVPVPPPIPAVKKIMSAPLRASAISLLLSIAAAAPTFGSPPAPRPRVTPGPSWMRVGARLDSSAW